jgi:hypothetical protein
MKTGLIEIYNSYRQIFLDNNNYYDFFLDKNYSNLRFFFHITNSEVVINKEHYLYKSFTKLFSDLNQNEINLHSSLNEFNINILNLEDSFIIKYNLAKESKINYIEINSENETFSNALNFFVEIVGTLNNFKTFNKTSR